MQITQWHKGTDKPVRDGVYRRQYPYGWSYCKFEKRKWKLPADTVEKASIEEMDSEWQELPWCGVTKP